MGCHLYTLSWGTFCIPYPYSVSVSPWHYDIPTLGPHSVFRIRIPYSYLAQAGRQVVGLMLYSVSVFRIRIRGLQAFGPSSVFRIRIPYSVLAGFGPSSVFRIRIRIPHLRLWGQLRIPYPYPYPVFHGTECLPNPPPYRTYAVSADGRSPNPGT